MLMKKISLLLVGVLALFSCEQEELDSVMESSCICGQVKIPHRTMIYLERELAPMEELYKDREKSGGIL